MAQAKSLSPAELDALMEFVSRRSYATRNRLILSFGFHAGMRVGEIASLTIGDVMNADGTVKTEVRLSAEQTKGRQPRTVFMPQRLQTELQTYLDLRQPSNPTHPLFEALKKHDYPAFAAQQLKERLEAGLPPSSFQALIRCDARMQAVAQAFLNHGHAQLQSLTQGDANIAALMAEVSVFPAVPMSIQRVANVERAQMLIECHSRKALQQFLAFHNRSSFIKNFFVHANQPFRQFSSILRMDTSFNKAIVDVTQIGGFELGHTKYSLFYNHLLIC